MNPYNKDRYSRRAFLKTIGISGACIPLIHAERALGATADGKVLRFFAMIYGNGARPNFYPSGNDFSAPFGTSLKPLEPFKAKMIMPIGLDYKNILDDGYQYDGHFTYCASLTGTRKKASESREALGPSIDQMIADDLAKRGVVMKQPLITFGIRSTGDGCSTSWRSAGVQNPAQQTAGAMFTKLFSAPNMAPAQVDNLVKQRKSVLDYVGKDLAAFGKRLGTDDRMKIEQHAVSVRNLENQLSAIANGTGGANCGTPTPGTSDVQSNAKAMFDIIAMAFKCDLNRAATITISDDGGGDGTSFPWANSSGDFHATAHASNDAQMSSITAWFMTNLANLAGQLDATTEGTGTALDNSILMTMSNMDEGNSHYNGKIPIVMIGSGGGFLKTNQVVRYQKEAHNKLLTTVCNAMGLPVTTVGAAQYAGTLAALIK